MAGADTHQPLDRTRPTVIERHILAPSFRCQALVVGGTNRQVEIVGVIKDVKSAGVNAPTPDEAYFPRSNWAAAAWL